MHRIIRQSIFLPNTQRQLNNSGLDVMGRETIIMTVRYRSASEASRKFLVGYPYLWHSDGTNSKESEWCLKDVKLHGPMFADWYVCCMKVETLTVFFCTQWYEVRKFLFWALSVTFLCMKYGLSRKPLNAKFTRKTSLVPRSDEFEGQGQRSKVKVTRDKKTAFRPFRRPACGLCLVKHL